MDLFDDSLFDFNGDGTLDFFEKCARDDTKAFGFDF